MAFATSLIGGARRAATARRAASGLSPEEQAMFDAMQSDIQPAMTRPEPQPAPMPQQPRPLIGGSMPQAKPQQAKPPSMWDGIAQDPLAFLLTGPAGVTRRQNEDAKRAAMEAEQQRMMEMAQAAGLDPGAMLAMYTNPEKFGESYAKNYEAANVNAGDSRVYGNGTPAFRAPQNLMNVANEGAVFNPETNQQIYRNQGPPKPPTYDYLSSSDGYYGVNTSDPKDFRRMPFGPPAKSDGINLQFGEGGALSGLSIGGTGPKGQEPAIIRGPGDKPVVSPGKQQLEANKDWKSLQDFNAQNGLVLEEINRALTAVKPGSTGPMAAMADIPIFGPSTDAGRLKNLVGTIKANVGFDKLQSMRENSPTGGALGQVAVQEINFLQSVFGSLETAQREEDVRYNLQRLAKFLEGRSERLKAAFAKDYPDLAQYTGFAKAATDQGKQLQSMSTEELQKRLAQLKGGQ